MTMSHRSGRGCSTPSGVKKSVPEARSFVRSAFQITSCVRTSCRSTCPELERLDPAGAFHFDVTVVNDGEGHIVHVSVLFRVEVPPPANRKTIWFAEEFGSAFKRGWLPRTQ